MCIAIFKPKNKLIPVPHLRESFLSNRDGAGFAASVNGRLIVKKGFMDFENFLSSYVKYENYASLIHFRIATSGGVNPENTHPFSMCNNRYALVHNGILDIKPHSKKSDTATFADAVIAPLLRAGTAHNSESLKFLVESAIGKGNKILVMDNAGEVAFFNEKQGHWADGIWYSNHSYMPFSAYDYLPSKSYSSSTWNRFMNGFEKGNKGRNDENNASDLLDDDTILTCLGCALEYLYCDSYHEVYCADCADYAYSDDENNSYFYHPESGFVDEKVGVTCQ